MMKPMPPELRRVLQPMVTMIAVALLLMMLALAGMLYTQYHFIVVEGHSQDDDLTVAAAVAVGSAIAIEVVALVAFIVAYLRLIRAGLLHWVATWRK
jgi:hypothetical protein